MRFQRALVMPLAVLGLLVFFVARAGAGDVVLQTQILLVNMTPDEFSGAASRQCVATIEKALASDSTMIRSQGETKTRASTGVAKGGAHFLTWKAAQFKELLRGHKYDGLRNAPVKDPSVTVFHSDSVLLVDCRPETNILDLLVAYGPTKESAQTLTMSLRGLELNGPLLKRVGARFAGYCYNRYWHNEGD